MAEEDVIKNSARESLEEDTAEYKKYIPQYRSLGISPGEANFAPRNEPLNNSNDSSEENIPIFNVGNNMEHAWLEEPSRPKKQHQINENKDYVLIADEQVILIGTLSQVEDCVRKIFYKEHDINKYNNFSVEQLTVLKKLKIKIGVFVE